VTRSERHGQLAEELERLSSEDLLSLLAASHVSDRGHGTLTMRGGTPVHVKLVPLSAEELAPENRDSTANFFGLPAYYGYRIGSCGLGAWRELEVHRRANEWALSGESPGVALLHHWRVLPLVTKMFDDRVELQRWGDDPAIRRRVSSILGATSSAVLFMEHLPQNLLEWFRAEFAQQSDPLATVTRIESELSAQLSSLHERGVLHMDAHFENILTDGEQLYLADFGLAIADDFEFDPEDRQFFERHQNFDVCTAINSLVHAVVTHYDPREDWRRSLAEITSGASRAGGAVPPEIHSFLEQRAPLVAAIGEFYGCLLADLDTPYPAERLQGLLDAARA
jgi:hypothetical protein